jgi:hypothetical protein
MKTLVHFLKNIWRFRKELWSHNWWDYRFTLNMLERSLTIMEKEMSEKGTEVSESREPKVIKMRRALELLKNSREDNFIDRAEHEIGQLKLGEWQFELLENGNKLIEYETEQDKEHNHKIYQRAIEIEEKEWKELWKIVDKDLRSWWD